MQVVARYWQVAARYWQVADRYRLLTECLLGLVGELDAIWTAIKKNSHRNNRLLLIQNLVLVIPQI